MNPTFEIAFPFSSIGTTSLPSDLASQSSVHSCRSFGVFGFLTLGSVDVGVSTSGSVHAVGGPS